MSDYRVDSESHYECPKPILKDYIFKVNLREHDWVRGLIS
jgi:hypothetical protein